jgi:hypothetical protein
MHQLVEYVLGGASSRRGLQSLPGDAVHRRADHAQTRRIVRGPLAAFRGVSRRAPGLDVVVCSP